ncbi:MAG TPA: hypothetical protein VFZ78_05580, partial [Flavisolibacter sp.]
VAEGRFNFKVIAARTKDNIFLNAAASRRQVFRLRIYEKHPLATALSEFREVRYSSQTPLPSADQWCPS